ncbi:beta-L-arabinofuranosidase domain-containing protein [Streptomyces sp. NPDC002920]
MRQALERLWQDMAARKTYVTGGMGSRHDWESFGDAHELPADRAYTETRPPTRTPWFRCACCPPNAMRLIASLPHYVASTDAAGLQLHQYDGGAYGGDDFTVRVATGYPWRGVVDVTVETAPASERTVSLRLPAWATGDGLFVNGTPENAAAQDGWLRVTRHFRPGDTLRLDLAIAPRLTLPGPRGDAVRGCVAIERGPLVYCLEQTDQPGGLDPDTITLDPAAPVAEQERPDLHSGLTTSPPPVALSRRKRLAGGPTSHTQRCRPGPTDPSR